MAESLGGLYAGGGGTLFAGSSASFSDFFYVTYVDV